MVRFPPNEIPWQTIFFNDCHSFLFWASAAPRGCLSSDCSSPLWHREQRDIKKSFQRYKMYLQLKYLYSKEKRPNFCAPCLICVSRRHWDQMEVSNAEAEQSTVQQCRWCRWVSGNKKASWGRIKKKRTQSEQKTNHQTTKTGKRELPTRGEEKHTFLLWLCNQPAVLRQVCGWDRSKSSRSGVLRPSIIYADGKQK